jgi:hypothetical protein
VAEKIQKLKRTNECLHPTVKVSVKLTDAGLVEVVHAEVLCEIREKKNLADHFKGLFGGGKDQEEQVYPCPNIVNMRLFWKSPRQTRKGLPAHRRVPLRWINQRK